MSEQRMMTHAEWRAEAVRRFGDDPASWRFVCPSCGYGASLQEWKDAGAEDAAAFSCVGRWTGGGDMGTSKPCNYAGGGFLRLNPVRVVMPDGGIVEAFDFAEAKEKANAK